MAKSPKSAESNAPVAAAVAASIVIQGLTFPVNPSYAEGHVLTAVEAAALNQLRGENLRNNFAKTVKDAKEAAEKAGTPLDTDALQAKFAEYERSYMFAGKRSGTRAPADPVGAELFKIAKQTVLTALKNRKEGPVDPKSLAEGVLDKLIAGAIEKRGAEWRAEAEARVAARNKIASESMEGLLDGLV